LGDSVTWATLREASADYSEKGANVTEAEWLACNNPGALLDQLGEKSSVRKCRLLGCACCRRIWDYFSDDEIRRFVQLVEAVADGSANELRLPLALEDMRRRGGRISKDAWAVWAAQHTAYIMPDALHTVFTFVARSTEDQSSEKLAQCHLLRDIFGNPFRTVTFDPDWRASTAVALAQQMYDSRDFAAMPILADALQDAGCENADILDHCRGPGPHVRGCWVVDLVLGKV
jgi:hypothetical protein